MLFSYSEKGYKNFNYFELSGQRKSLFLVGSQPFLDREKVLKDLSIWG